MNELVAIRFPDGTVVRTSDIEAIGEISTMMSYHASYDKPQDVYAVCMVHLASGRDIKIRLTERINVVWKDERERVEELKTRGHIVREQLMRQIWQVVN